jgi:TPP-dependent pyruvate/acetoin dehydrogenase alpha subunit
MLHKAPPEGDAPFRLLADDGAAGGDLPSFDEHALWHKLCLARAVEQLARVPGAASSEAALAAASMLRDGDWVLASPSLALASLARLSPAEVLAQLHGTGADHCKGRQAPGHPSSRAARWLSTSAAATHLPQAAGLGWAARLAGKEDVALALFDEEATASGDFHVGLNFAAVYRAQCVFFCVNQRRAETGSPGVAEKSRAYGMSGVLVDGGDLVAVLAVVEDALARARAGQGPTLIEALAADTQPRWRAFLQSRGMWTQAAEDAQVKQASDEISVADAAAQAAAPPDVTTLWQDVFGAK